MRPKAVELVASIIDRIEDRPFGAGHPPVPTVEVIRTLRFFVREGVQWSELRAVEGRASGLTPRRRRDGWRASTDGLPLITYVRGLRTAAIFIVANRLSAFWHPKVRAWLEKHPRWVFHFTPTSASWLNAVEGFFAKLTTKRLRRASFRGIVDLQAAIHRFIAEHNNTAKRFVWTADPDRIIASINKAKRASGADH